MFTNLLEVLNAKLDMYERLSGNKVELALIDGPDVDENGKEKNTIATITISGIRGIDIEIDSVFVYNVFELNKEENEERCLEGLQPIFDKIDDVNEFYQEYDSYIETCVVEGIRKYDNMYELYRRVLREMVLAESEDVQKLKDAMSALTDIHTFVKENMADLKITDTSIDWRGNKLIGASKCRKLRELKQNFGDNDGVLLVLGFAAEQEQFSNVELVTQG